MASLGTINQTSATADAAKVAIKRLRETTDQVVGSVFYGTLLKTMRAGTMRGKYGHGGRGEEIFAAQLDQLLADRAGAARGYDLGDAIVKQLSRQAEAMLRRREGVGDQW